MNISLNWLKEYLDIEMPAEEVADALTSIGLETGSVEEVESIRGGLRGLVIGKVLTCEAHPDSDHLHITTVDLGDGQATQIVCGAPNVAAGQTVVVATVGTTLYDGDKEFKIKKSKIRGVESFGMICAEDEIGVGTSHDGIIVITDDIRPGTPAAEYYGLTSDYVLEVDLTPNRIDAASHYGVARDLAAWMAMHRNARQLHRPSVDGFALDRPDGGIAVEVADAKACPRYSGITVRGVRVGESPEWLRTRLSTIGVRPINNIVDITNYILHAFCQPLHCFDLNKIEGDKIIVAQCPTGTPFTTLDGVERKLDERDLCICNGRREPMCIAGVFGGLDSGVTETTTDIFIESACFNPTDIRKTARRHGLQTDASFRYERGVDPNGTVYALKLAAMLVKEIAGGEICGPVCDIYPAPVAPYPVTLGYESVDRLIGKKLGHDTIDKILGLLEIAIASRREGELDLEVPTYRVDVRRPCDVIEDILRIYGYNNIEFESRLHASLSYKTHTDLDNELRRRISEQLTGEGFNEILNNSLTSVKYYTDNAAMPLDRCVALLNPLSQDLGVMRQTLLYGGLESLGRNINRRRPDLAFYEFGNVYVNNPAVTSTAEAPLAPYREEARLALWLTGNIRHGNWARQAEPSSFFDLKAAVLNILTRMGIDSHAVQLTPDAEPTPDFEASLSLTTRSGKLLGTMGILSAPLLKRFEISQSVAYADLRWNELANLSIGHNVSATMPPKTHPVKRDLALLVSNDVTMAMIETVVGRSEKKLLRAVELFDVYEGKNLPAGKKSYAISMTLQDDEKTLNDKQIDAVMNKIIANLKRELHAELR